MQLTNKIGFKGLTINTNSFLKNSITASRETRQALSTEANSTNEDSLLTYMSEGLSKQKKDVFVSYQDGNIRLQVTDTQKRRRSENSVEPETIETPYNLYRLTTGTGYPHKLSAPSVLKAVKNILKDNGLYQERKIDSEI